LADPSHCFLISIGDNCTICPNVRLIAHDASTKKHLGHTKIGTIDIKENCFLGDSVIVLPGVTIGPNTIIGAGSVVTKTVPANSVAAGNPSHVISSIDEYLKKIERKSIGKKIFGKDYYIDKLDEEKRAEIIRSIGKTIGFIV
jgi:maltose O-acetyltransferase